MTLLCNRLPLLGGIKCIPFWLKRKSSNSFDVWACFHGMIPFRHVVVALVTLTLVTANIASPTDGSGEMSNPPGCVRCRQTRRSVEELINESFIMQLLVNLPRQPELLSVHELRSIRGSIPSVAEQLIDLLNSEHLLEAVSGGRIAKEDFYELKSSLTFLKAGNHPNV